MDVILMSNSYWINDETPCLNYSMRGLIKLDVAVTGPE